MTSRSAGLSREQLAELVPELLLIGQLTTDPEWVGV